MSLQRLLVGGVVLIAVALVCPCVFGVHDDVWDELRALYDEPIEVNGFTVTKGMDVCVKSVSADQWFEARVVATSISVEGGKQLVQIHYSDPQNLPNDAKELVNKREKAPNNKFHKTINVAGPNKALIKQSCKEEETTKGGGSATIGEVVLPEEIQETDDEVVDEIPTKEVLVPEIIQKAEDEAVAVMPTAEQIQETDGEVVDEIPTTEVLVPEMIPETEDEDTVQVTHQEVENKFSAATSCDEGPDTVKTVDIVGFISQSMQVGTGDAQEWRDDVYVLAKKEQSGRYNNPGGPHKFIDCPEKWEVDESVQKEKGAKAIMGDIGGRELDFEAAEDIVIAPETSCHVYALEIEPNTDLEDYWTSHGIEKVKCLDEMDDMNLEDEFKRAIITMGICIQAM